MVKNRFSLLSLFFLVGCYCSAQTAFEKKISDLGFSEIVTDWSDSAEINIPKPKCAYVNVTGMTDIPPKGFPLKGWFEVYDGNGNYFKKRILMDGQGQTSRKADKKNFEVDFCDDLWLNDSTPEITIGDWVDQDSYHFKAFYSDFLRGTGIIAYQVYDEMTNDRGEYGRMWERALENIKNPDTNARCFPDAFPCVVYMNGKFYGLYCWQLKKHRKNMNLKKNNGEHIHLHGFMNNNFFKGAIEWDRIEVKNPKNLYDMDGKPYEDYAVLIDETSPYFDLETDDKDTRKIKETTAKVKSSILNLTHYNEQLKALEAKGASRVEMRAAIEERFDMTSLCDYIIHNLVTDNWDGMAHNFQFFTYDGKKWFISPYDLDNTFGHFFGGICPASYYYTYPLTAQTFKNYALFAWAVNYFMDEIRSRYAELRNKGVLTTENIVSLFETWYYSFGEENYRLEFERWPLSPSLFDDIPNEGWELLPFTYKGYTSSPTYSASKEYHEGDQCRLEYRIWRATKTMMGVTPYKQIGSKDSLERVQTWMAEHLMSLDSYMKYTFESTLQTYTLQMSSVGWSSLCLPFQFAVPEGMEVYAVAGRDEKGHLLTTAVSAPEANKPYLVKAPPGNYVLTGYTEEADVSSDSYLRNGLLQGCYVERFVPRGCYVLQNHNGTKGFYRVSEDGSVKIGPNRAYLTIDGEDLEADEYTLDGGDVTIARQMNAEDSQIVGIFDMGGQRQDKLRKGLNLVRYSDGTTIKMMKR